MFKVLASKPLSNADSRITGTRLTRSDAKDKQSKKIGPEKNEHPLSKQNADKIQRDKDRENFRRK